MSLLLRSWAPRRLAPLQRLVRWFGGWSLLVLLVTLAGGVLWWRWDSARQLPLPPLSEHRSLQYQGALLKQTEIISSLPAPTILAFYREQLRQRGWAYCGTQATPGCTNLVNLIDGSGARVDVYRRPEDRDRSGPSVEIKAVPTPQGTTYVVIWEANRYARLWE